VNGLYHSSDIPGRDYVDSERYGITGALGWQASDALSFALDYYHFRSDGMSDYGHPFDPATREPYDVDPDNFYGAVGRDFLENEADIGTFAIQWDLSPDVTIKNQARYGELDNRYIVSVPRAPREATADDVENGFTIGQLVVDTGTPQRNATTEYFGDILTLNADVYTGSIEHALVLGGEISDEKVTNRRYAFPPLIEDENGDRIATPGGFTRDLFDPDPVLGFEIPAVVDTSSPPALTEIESASIFAIDTIKFSPRFELLLGLRYDTFDITASGAGRGGPYNEEASYDFLNYQASALYKPSEPVSLYASFATSSNPSGEQLDSSSPSYGGIVGIADLEPERNKAYEVGVKYEVNGGDMLLTAAAFRIDKDNARENLGGGNYALVGKQRSQGIELGANGNLTERLSVFGGYTYLDSEIVDSDDAASIGRRFANVPEHTFSMLSTYQFSDRFSLGGQAFYRSRIYGGDPDANDNSVPGYWKFDAVARFQVTENVELRANVLNIFDERYYDAIYRSGSPFSYIAPGRSATLAATIDF
jgi:catecholate siderophore receptor